MLWVAAGGACGALLRYAVQIAAAGSLPWGTFLVNVAGCLGIGALLAAFSGSQWFEAVGRPFLVFGVLGAFTTFSAFSADTLALYEQGRFGWALAYVLGTVAMCLLAAFVGFRLVGALR